MNHAQTLREQGVEDTETVILRRKYFYSDSNVDSRDPIQLNLLYVQVGSSYSVPAMNIKFVSFIFFVKKVKNVFRNVERCE